MAYFNQDAYQPGFKAIFTNQAPTQPKGATALTIMMPAADQGGHSTSFYINGDPNGETDGVTLPNGHYKVTVYGKDGQVIGKKAKSKVFWVKCKAQPTTPPTSTSTTTPPPTSTSTTTPPPATSTTSTTTPPPATSTTSTTTPPPPASTSTPPASSTGPVVVTDGPSGGSNGMNGELLGGGLGAAGIALLGYGLLRRRLSE